MRLILQVCCVFSLWISVVESLFCAKCSNVTNINDCKSFVQCSDHESCYVEGNNLSLFNQEYELGCMSKTVCSHLNRRREVSKRSGFSCVSCCDNAMCNLNLCSYDNGQRTTVTSSPSAGLRGTTATPVTPSTQDCHDEATNCNDAQIISLVCNVDPNQCRKSCGLCSITTTSSIVQTRAHTLQQQHNVCHDHVPECRCQYMDKELGICSDHDSRDMFCCYYCKAKYNPHNFMCPDMTCEAEKAKFIRNYPDPVLNITCH